MRLPKCRDSCVFMVAAGKTCFHAHLFPGNIDWKRLIKKVGFIGFELVMDKKSSFLSQPDFFTFFSVTLFALIFGSENFINTK